MAIREIVESGILFFTQKGSKKVLHIQHANQVSLTIILSSGSHQITFRGHAFPISRANNLRYWHTYPKTSQLRFMSYGPDSGQPVAYEGYLEDRLAKMQHLYATEAPEMPPSYVGYKIVPNDIELYQLNLDKISEAFIAQRDAYQWKITPVVP